MPWRLDVSFSLSKNLGLIGFDGNIKGCPVPSWCTHIMDTRISCINILDQNSRPEKFAQWGANFFLKSCFPIASYSCSYVYKWNSFHSNLQNIGMTRYVEYFALFFADDRNPSLKLSFDRRPSRCQESELRSVNLTRELQMSQEESQQLQEERGKLMADVQADAACGHTQLVQRKPLIFLGNLRGNVRILHSNSRGFMQILCIRIRIRFISGDPDPQWSL